MVVVVVEEEEEGDCLKVGCFVFVFVSECEEGWGRSWNNG